MIEIYEFALSTAIIILAELADKTMVATVSTVLASGRILKTVIVATLAFTLANIIPVVGAITARFFLPTQLLLYVSSALFIFFGLFYILFEPREERYEGKFTSKSLVAVFSLVALSELGDKTQLSLMALALEARSAVCVFLGAIMGFFTLNIVASILLTRIVKVDYRSLSRIVGLVFVLVGLASFLNII